MRRVLVWLFGTAVGTTLLVGAKAAPGVLLGGAAAVPSQAEGPPVGAGSPAVGGSPAVAPTTAVPTATTVPAGPTKPAAPAPAQPAPAARTILGDPYQAKDFGAVQVKVVLTGTHIDDIIVVKMSNRPLNAPSILRQAALTKQSAVGLPNVSGATYTSRAYVQSLQSALAKA